MSLCTYLLYLQMDTTTFVLLVVSMSCGVIPTSDAIDVEKTLKCHIREYTYRISQPYTLENGTELPCYDDVSVDSCWGRCDSNEVNVILSFYLFSLCHLRTTSSSPGVLRSMTILDHQSRSYQDRPNL